MDFQSPEMTDHPESLSPVVDLYSLGKIFAYLLTGNRHDSLDGLPPTLQNLLRSLLARSPGDRPRSALEVARVLKPFAACDDLVSYSVPASYLPEHLAIECGRALSGLVPGPGDRAQPLGLTNDETFPWARLADSTLVDSGLPSPQPFELPPEEPKPPPTGLASLSGFAVLGLAVTIMVTTVLVAAAILRQFGH
jgi:hypothetical protein